MLCISISMREWGLLTLSKYFEFFDYSFYAPWKAPVCNSLILNLLIFINFLCFIFLFSAKIGG